MNGHAPAVDSPACPCWWVIKGRQQGVLPPLCHYSERGIFHDRTRKVSRTYPACANIGQIPNLEKLVATIRSREISACLDLQSRSQLKAIYKDNADTIVGNMDSQIFLGGSEPTTLKDLSEMLGKETIDSFNTSDTRGNSPSYGTTFQKMGHELLSRDELAVLDGGKCVLQLRGVRPFLSDKYDLTQHLNYKLTSDYDPKNTFDIEKYLNRKEKINPNDEFVVIDADSLPSA